MIAPDLIYQLIIAIALLIFNGLITSFFVYNRWNLSAMMPSKRWATLLTTFTLTIIFLLSLQFSSKQSFEIWLVVYTVTMTIIAFGEFFTKRLKD